MKMGLGGGSNLQEDRLPGTLHSEHSGLGAAGYSPILSAS